MERAILDSIGPLQAKVKSWWRTLLFLVISFLLHLVLPTKIGKIYFGETYTWAIPIGVLLLLLSWDIFRLCRKSKKAWSKLTVPQRRALMTVNPKDKSLTLIEKDSDACKQLESIGWFEPPIYAQKVIADLERDTVTYRLTPTAIRYMRKYKIRPFHEQTR